ncbi:MAG TPA: hypothetical protein PKD70_10925 [Saprospiraceae bacterium]|nr:hypothetical protein [Saprospiraceae bacterium]
MIHCFVAITLSTCPGMVQQIASDTLPVPLQINVAPEAKRWRDFVSYDGRFRALAPGDLREKIDSIQTPLGKLAYHIFFFQMEDPDADNVVYMITYCDYPAGVLHADSAALLEAFFDVTVQTAASSVRGEVLYVDDWQYKRYPGKVWRIRYLNGKALIKTRAFVVSNRYYMIQTITRRERTVNYSSDKFFDSFRLLE